jgi:hypothetical protein
MQAFALDGRISPLGDEDVELCPEPGAISRPTSPLSALSSSGGGMAGGGIIGKGSALLPVMFFNPVSVMAKYACMHAVVLSYSPSNSAHGSWLHS